MRVLSMNLGIIRAETGEMEAFYGEKYKIKKNYNYIYKNI